MRPHVFAATVFAGLSFAGVATAQDAQSDRVRQRDTTRFQGMDRNNDGVITRAEWRGSDQSFRVHDWNGDGILSGNEVRVGATREMGEEDDYDQTRRPQFSNWTERGFANLDHNGDGRVSRAEWHYDLESFRRADRNRDSSLTRAEFLGTNTDNDREDRFEYLDANRDGRVERSEWHGSRDAFDWMDRNNDNVLSRSEVAGDEADETDLFASLDYNGDDTITQDEWHWSRRSFTRQDTNGDGRLTRRELTNAELSAANTGTGAVGTSGRTVVVDGTRRWVDTGVDVRSGETVAIQAEGTVGLSDNDADVAGPGGSRSGRRAQGAPLPDQPAGALIARIDDSAPIFIGDRQTFTANRSGRLYLSVNDDHLLDNRGQFRVTVAGR
jgi:Ca2+-binding EF-hand superfamily protein